MDNELIILKKKKELNSIRNLNDIINNKESDFENSNENICKKENKKYDENSSYSNNEEKNIKNLYRKNENIKESKNLNSI
jgi:hypothetical protein